MTTHLWELACFPSLSLALGLVTDSKMGSNGPEGSRLCWTAMVLSAGKHFLGMRFGTVLGAGTVLGKGTVLSIGTRFCVMFVFNVCALKGTHENAQWRGCINTPHWSKLHWRAPPHAKVSTGAATPESARVYTVLMRVLKVLPACMIHGAVCLLPASPTHTYTPLLVSPCCSCG